MAKRKTANIILICAVLTPFLFYGVKALAGTLSCTVRANSCLGGETAIWRMSGTSNAHAELPSQSNYNQLVCCSGVTGLGNSCSGNYAIALKLSGTTNAHVEQNSQTNYANNACISVPAGGSVSVGYQSTNCTGFDTTLGSMSGVTNAHVGNAAAYTTKICATASAVPAVSISLTTDGSVSFGTLEFNVTRDTTPSGLNDPETVLIDSGPADLDIRTTIFSGSGNNWNLGTSNGNETVKWEFQLAGGSWTTFEQADYLYTLATNVPQGETRTVYFRLTTPNPTVSSAQHSATVTIVASAP